MGHILSRCRTSRVAWVSCKMENLILMLLLACSGESAEGMIYKAISVAWI